MRDLINSLFRWLAKNVVTLIVVIAILIGGGFAKQQWKKFELANESIREQLRESREATERIREETEKSVTALVPPHGATQKLIDEELKGIEKQIKIAKKDQQVLLDKYTFGFIPPTSPDFQKRIELEIRIELLEQVRSHVKELYEESRNRFQSLKEAEAYLANLRAHKKRIENLIRSNIAAQKKLSTQDVPLTERSIGPVIWDGFSTKVTYTDKRVDRLKKALVPLLKSRKQVEGKIDRQEKRIASDKNFGKVFKVSPFKTEGQRQLELEIEKFEKQLADNWFQRAAKPVTQVLPTALGIVFLIIVTPIAIKLFMFYVIAPLAARRPGIRLLPGSSGLIQFGANNELKRTGSLRASTVSKSIILDDKSELLVHPEFLQSASLAAKKETKWLLDWTMPLTSLASDMYGLTRVYPDGLEPVVISSSKDPLIEISEIDLPAGSAVVLQPRCLVGIVRRPDDPVRIKGYWRFGLSNWLTMQLRYVVFHGPARLIVKGCRGIRIEPVNTGRAINQAAMLGFSANLQYAVTRCETFGSYLMGKQELFNDRFSGQPGCCIYEETPHPNARTGVTGRGIEGVIDSVLKVFGI